MNSAKVYHFIFSRNTSKLAAYGIIRTGRLEHLNDPKRPSIQPSFYLYSASPAFCTVLFTQNAQSQSRFFRQFLFTNNQFGIRLNGADYLICP